MSSYRCARTACSRWESCSSSPSRSARPEAGPSTIATATARLRRTIGLPVKDSSVAYALAISAQRVEAYELASSWSAAIEATSWYSPMRPATRVALSSCRPSLMSARSQSERSCWASGTRAPSAEARAGGELEAATSQLGLRPADALRHRRLGDEVRGGDLTRREAGDGTQRQRDRQRRRERVIAAEEQHHQR